MVTSKKYEPAARSVSPVAVGVEQTGRPRGESAKPIEVVRQNYANGDRYAGDSVNGRRHGQGAYQFKEPLNVEWRRSDKAVLAEPAFVPDRKAYLGRRKVQAGSVFRTRPGKPSGARVDVTAHGSRPVFERRPVEIIRVTHVQGKWKNDKIVEGEIHGISRQGSLVKKSVEHSELKLLASAEPGHHLTSVTSGGSKR